MLLILAARKQSTNLRVEMGQALWMAAGSNEHEAHFVVYPLAVASAVRQE